MSLPCRILNKSSRKDCGTYRRRWLESLSLWKISDDRIGDVVFGCACLNSKDRSVALGPSKPFDFKTLFVLFYVGLSLYSLHIFATNILSISIKVIL